MPSALGPEGSSAPQRTRLTTRPVGFAANAFLCATGYPFAFRAPAGGNTRGERAARPAVVRRSARITAAAPQGRGVWRKILKHAYSKSNRLSLVLALIVASALLTFGCTTTRSTGQTGEGTITSSVPAPASPGTVAGGEAAQPAAPAAPFTPPASIKEGAAPPAAPMTPGGRYRVSAFVRDAGAANAAAVAFGSLPRTRSADGNVKRYADSVSDEQRTVALELQRLCTQFGESMPREMNAQDKQTYTRLSSLKGEAFDRAFTAAMLSFSQRHVDIYTRAVTQLPDGDFRLFASRTLQSLNQHLTQAQLLDQQIGTAPDDIAPNP